MTNPSPPPRWRAFHLAKRGNAADEYEDAFAGDPGRGRFAVADGASESSFAAEWARLLADGFVASPGRPWRDTDWLAPLRRRWAAAVDGRPLPWYAEAKREQGAFATFLGICFRPPRRGRKAAVWRALAVGDSCLFRTRKGRLRQASPVTRAADFNNLPALLGSRERPADTPAGAVQRLRGRWRPGDRFLLMTDALAEWYLRQTEEGGRPAEGVGRLLAEDAPEGAFAAWVEEGRERHGLRNDDVTLLIIDL
jgi:hypothetical protein